MQQPEADQDEIVRRRDDLYLKVAIVALVLLGVNLALGWILQYYFNESLLSQISFMARDPSWVPIGTHFSPALGVHYFGDFEIIVGEAAGHISPFSSGYTVPAAYGPAGIAVVGVLHGIFGWPGSVFVFLIASLLAFLWGLARLLGPSLSARLLAILLLFSAGVLFCLDRGNLQILLAALCVWFAVGLLENRQNLDDCHPRVHARHQVLCCTADTCTRTSEALARHRASGGTHGGVVRRRVRVFQWKLFWEHQGFREQ